MCITHAYITIAIMHYKCITIMITLQLSIYLFLLAWSGWQIERNEQYRTLEPEHSEPFLVLLPYP